MKDRENYYDQIDDYLLGHLSEEAKAAFEQALQSDESLAEALASQERIRKGMMEGGRRELRADLKEIHQQMMASEKPTARVRKINGRSFLAAAAVLLLGILAWWLWMPNGPNTERIFADNFTAYNLKINQRDYAKGPEIPQVIRLYRNEQYTAAIPLLEELQNENAQLQLALAIARFQTGEYNTAFAPLTKIIESNDPFLGDLAKWYSALFHLQLNQTEEAIPLLQALANDPDADKHQAAKNILKQIQ